eukprot:CAMPEP_0195507254 /NCGR_PEP_ID=MMETSP0794_2-20130614/740_1 /TAXON_ID=515487 /ORGANISM="Stephanopyxis turris, Strain CCMP 815" /LENGTH=183 /DNA_ID=CAMNT_0040633877 /DNA_START=210 /DNA_END=761 /DNA_ORIENTATION=-
MFTPSAALSALRKASRSNFVRPATPKEQVKQGSPLIKQKLQGRKNHHAFWQLTLGSSLFAVFVASPFLGKKIAQDPEFRKYVPAWYDFTLKKNQKGMTKEEFHDMFIEVQKEMHERAIKGEFTDDKLAKMDWKKEKIGGNDVSAQALEQGWGKLHPLDDEEEYEDDPSDHENVVVAQEEPGKK